MSKLKPVTLSPAPAPQKKPKRKIPKGFYPLVFKTIREKKKPDVNKAFLKGHQVKNKSIVEVLWPNGEISIERINIDFSYCGYWFEFKIHGRDVYVYPEDSEPANKVYYRLVKA